MKKYLFLALGVAALTSCSSDEVTELNQGNEIKFSVVADNDSRAANIYCNNNKMTSFTVYANVGSTDFITNEEFTEENGVFVSNESKRYWPEYDAVDFYAFQNLNGTFNWSAGSTPTVTGYTPETTISEQKDFVYATETDETKPANGTLGINFRHALSQIEFQAKNENPDLWVEILDVKVGNAKSVGNFTFASESTKDVIVDHNQTGTTTPTDGTSRGSWDAWVAGATTNYDYTIGTEFGAAIPVAYTTVENDKIVKLSINTTIDEEGNYTKGYAKSMLLLPQTSVAWTTAAKTGTYLAVKCRIWNIVDGDETKKVLLYGDANNNDQVDEGEGRWASVPVKFEWEPGKKYVYTFNFTNGGNAGYEDDTNGDPTETAVLIPMSLTFTVDDFQVGENSTENMETVPVQQDPNP